MMQYSTRLPVRLGLLACLAAGATLSLQAGQAAEPLAQAATPLNLVTACAVLLGLLALLLLWRQHRLAARLRVQEQLRASAEQGRMACEQQKAREQERLRIGRDIHDDLGQHLLTLKIDLSMLQIGLSATAPPLAQKLALIARNVDLSIAALRCVIHDLRPPALEHGLQAAVDGLLAEFSRSTGIACDYAGGGALADGAAGTHDALLYHALQESLANIARHAQATQVRVGLRRHAATLELRVSDNGIGMPASTRLGCGLSGMHERLACAGGCLHIDSRSGSGTTLQLTVPLPPAPDGTASHC
ncbi:sensor histidine kinase [Janthinobacterium sp.]|uniref:sensor histidine kinase n=1 Tax=Janthinobacterium sp. TaxID=1871054 RepID=UPI0025BA5FE5|nr:sensor histidine kinase [Janthinobacterium sp.]NBV18447.1 sensor histidine kinase [Janthinobacterium sp.]